MGLLGRGKTAHNESPAIEKQPIPLEQQVAGDDTHHLVSTTSGNMLQQHYWARGRPQTPLYIVSQVQSCNMSPLGLLGFGLTTALLQGATTTIAEPGTESLTYCFAIGFGGIAQLLAGMWEARRGKIFGAVVFSSYGAFWISFGLFGILATPGVIAGGMADPIPDGQQMMLCLWGIITFLFLLCALALNLCLQLLLLLLTVTFFLLSKGVHNKGVNEVGGWFGIATAAVAIYIGFAELFNETHQRNIFPLFPVNWLAMLMPTRRKPVPYDVNRTEARGFPATQGEYDYDDPGMAANRPQTGAGGVHSSVPGDARMAGDARV